MLELQLNKLREDLTWARLNLLVFMNIHLRGRSQQAQEIFTAPTFVLRGMSNIVHWRYVSFP